MRSIRAKISFAMLTLILISVTVISLLSNDLINKQFTVYIKRQQELRTQVITATLSEQYVRLSKKWDMDYIHTIGMLSLYEGYILKVYDKDHQILWDAQSHDMALCDRIMEDISERMRIKYPGMEGEFQSASYPLTQSGIKIGSVSISYFGPFFLSENDFKFLEALNKVLIGVGLTSLFLSIFVGGILARRISRPILNTVDAAKEIADGNYGVRLTEETDTSELKLLMESINHLATSLDTLERLRRQLTEDVAHELRTPITIIQSHIEAIMEGVWEPTPDRLQSCYDETVRIGKLVKDLEQLAKLESNNLKLCKSKVQLIDLLNKTKLVFEGELQNKNLSVMVEGPNLEISVDPDRLQQVFINLMSNAVKYSKENGRILMETFEGEGIVGILIKDNGKGIPKEELPYIFERFYRADKSRNRMTGGAGIGLTIVKSIVEAHGGKVKVSSTLNEGSTFTVILPKG